MAMRTSAAGRAALTVREGVRLDAYRDSVGVWTIGVGHASTAPTPPKPVPGMTITRAEADAILEADLAVFEQAINGAIQVPVGQNQFDAMASLAFNIGAHGFVGSTVVHKLNAGDPAGAADAFLMWEKPQALKARRIAERAQFLTPDGAIASSPPPADTTVTDVKALQANLTTLKFYGGLPDGDFGLTTLAAVKAFQVAHGLTPDGVVGDKTFAAIDAALALLAPAKVEIPPAVAGPHLLPKPAPRTGLAGWWDRITGKA